jgi:Ca2+-binding EF-hand superfamily protein
MGSGLSTQQKHLVKETPFEARELRKLRAVFAQVKGNKKDDELTREEFKQVFKLCAGDLAIEGTEEKKGVDLDEIFDSVDTDRSGTVSYKEMVLWLSIYLRGSEEDKLKRT